jgi:hypothetical protein
MSLILGWRGTSFLVCLTGVGRPRILSDNRHCLYLISGLVRGDGQNPEQHSILEVLPLWGCGK